MKRICIYVSILLCLLLSLAGCETATQLPEEHTVETSNLTEEEMAELSDLASEYENNAKFLEAAETYQKLYDAGCTEGKYFGFSNKNVKEAFETIMGNLKRESISCYYVHLTVELLKDRLRDPYSLVIYKVTFETDYGTDRFTVKLDYGAKNSFGGMVRDSYSGIYKLSNREKNTVYQTLKEWMDSRGATIDDAAAYLSANSYIYKDSIYAAIVNETQTYYE